MTTDCDICAFPLIHGGHLCPGHLTEQATIDLRIEAATNAGRDPERADLIDRAAFEARRQVGCRARLQKAAAGYDAANDALLEVGKAILGEEQERFVWKRKWVDQLHLALCRAVQHQRELDMQAARAAQAAAYGAWSTARLSAEQARVAALTPEEAATERWQQSQQIHGYDGPPGQRTGD